MTAPALAHKPFGLLLAALLCVAGSWIYAQRVLIRYQIADTAAHNRPRGNLSDLYPRWFGARELLLHERDPYGPDVTREIQQGYYGRPLDPSRPADPKDQQRFAYPVYVVFYLAPTIRQSFAVVREEFFWILLVLTSTAVLVWLDVLRWSLPAMEQAAIVILVLGSLPVVQGLKLQQMTLLVAALVAVVIGCFMADRQIAAGVVLALATIKPQLVFFLLLWLLLWTVADWRRRSRWLLSFGVTLIALILASEHYLPDWLPRFFQAVRDYQSYTDAVSIVAKLIPSPWSVLAGLLAAAAAAYIAWKNCACAAGTGAFSTMALLVLAVTVIVIPSYALYNQVLLLPALLWLVRERRVLWQGGTLRRGLLLLVAVFVVWPWATSLVLAGLSFVLRPGTVEAAWAVPFWTSLLLPPGVAALVLIASGERRFVTAAEPHAS